MQFVNILALVVSLLPLGVLSNPVPDSVDIPGQQARSITVPDARSVIVDERDVDLETYAVPIPIELTSTKRAVEKMTERDTSANKLFARTEQSCLIVGNSQLVNCRTGPGTSYPAKYQVHLGTSYKFNCYKTGTCYEGNCSWDREVTTGCYVNGYYTDNSCTAAKLGKC